MSIQISNETELRILFSELFKLSPEHNLDTIFPSLAICTKHMMDRGMISYAGLRRSLEVFLYFHQIEMSKEIAAFIELNYGEQYSPGIRDIISILHSDESTGKTLEKALYCLKSFSYEEKITQINTISLKYLEGSNLADLKSILDLACGTGLAGPVIRNAGFTGQLVGVDISPHMLGHAESKNCYDHLIETDIQTFAYECRETFDLVVMLDAAPHFTLMEIKSIIKGIFNIVKSNGEFLMNAPIVSKNSQSVWSNFGLHRFSNTNLEDALTDAGFVFSHADDPDGSTRRYICRKEDRPPA